jgi:cytochrome c oxidase subunit 3
VTVTQNPFGRHIADGVYLNEDGSEAKRADGTAMTFHEGQSYLLHFHDGAVSGLLTPNSANGKMEEHEGIKIKYTTGPYAGQTKEAAFGPKAFGALFFFITGFHGFHVFSGVVFLAIIMINAAGGLYASRKNGYEMVEKIGLYWHFVDLVWVFVFLVFYLL